MLNRSSICILPIATLFICPVVWLALHSDLPLNNARAAASTALPPKTAASGVNYWSIGCRDDYYYSMAINAEQRDSVCTRDALAQTAESAPHAVSSDP